MKNVLVLAHDDVGQEARLQAALDLARALGGHLTCLDVSVLPTPIADMTGVYDMVLLTDEQGREADNRTRTEARLARDEVPFTWIDTTGDAVSCLAEAARLADVIVVSGPPASEAESGVPDVAADLLARAEIPVLTVPADGRGVDPRGLALFGWDGSARCMDALRAVEPLLAIAGEVRLIEVDDCSIETHAEEGALYLSRHRIRAEVVRKHISRREDPAPHLLAYAATERPAYLAIGGFGHGRLREALFGGVTRRLLEVSPVPLLLAR